MAGELRHAAKSGSLSESDYESNTEHSLDSQARGDILISNTAGTGLIRLPKSATTGAVLVAGANDPEYNTGVLIGAASNQLRIPTLGAASLLLGHTAGITQADGENSTVQIHFTDSRAAYAAARWSADAGGPSLLLAKSRNAAVGTNTIVQANDTLGRIIFSGDDGTNLNTPAAEIRAIVNGTPGENDMPGALLFLLTADAGAAVTERVRFHADGGVTVGAALASQGAGTINAGAVYDDGVILTDYVFEPDYRLASIAEMREFYERELHLPTIPGRAEWEQRKFALGKLVTHLWETVEVQARYIAELDARYPAWA